MTTALATVAEQSSLTLGDPARLTNGQLADIVIEGVKKLRHYLPYIIVLKNRFDAGDRDSTNRLRKPIKDSYSWKEFCEKHLDRTPRALGKALATPKSTKDVPQITDVEFANYEREHPHVRQSAANMIDKGMTPTDVVGALVGMGIPAPMAEAAVRIVSGVDATGVHPFEELQIHLSHLRPAFCDTNGEKEFVRVLEKARSTPVTDDRRELAQIDVGMLREIADELLSVAADIEQHIGEVE